MRDMPDIARFAIVVLLLASLLLMMRQCGSGADIVPFMSADAGSKEKPAAEVAAKIDLYPPVPAVSPDLNDGYVFNEERTFEENDLGVPGISGDALIDLEDVIYSGSLIAGDIRKALVAYQEKVPVQGGRRPAARGRGAQPKSGATGNYQHEQLEPGEIFLGYRVAIVEADRIVFEKGGEQVEKFLYDGSKARVVIKSSSAPAQTTAPGTTPTVPTIPASAVDLQVPPPIMTRGPGGSGLTVLAPAAGGEGAPAAPATRRVRRSQRLLGLDPSFMAPPPPTGAGNQTLGR